MTGKSTVAESLDDDHSVTATLHGIIKKSQWLIHAKSVASPEPLSDNKSPGFRVDSDSSIHFPLQLSLTTPSPPLSLVGVGVRKVSFLRIQVYSAGFYLDEKVANSLRSVKGWSTFTAQHLLTPPVPASEDLESPRLSGEGLVRTLLDSGATCAVRIGKQSLNPDIRENSSCETVPVRNTDFGHLRDGFTRALTARQKLARKSGQLTDADEDRVAVSMHQFKTIFPAGSVPKGKSLVLYRSPSGLTVEYEGRALGTVNDSWVGTEMMLAYFADKDVISPKLKEDVARGLEERMKG
ncbi:hypothetical protein TREMEDRAFT_64756 [Tremella mesenterica DSM 1558]|uniref:uncharacterized protein n=1 Tax=Tremella mesenterica (strain ATCC 24925 / CBS 8224 / DSM 1558 / NBRC 9311 / NRRL Y-6157 / RJB 2259-6 / UBC 559-6) TaxID=578456 RepID=UPI0003F49366|nr:uncharacterized protein TREMEDRAFT_64756 [Tremella mesenterica DSM 1558]EIW66902.1 hypothetical protein TREMEDRAFT_64756 [Tremella mesenterica DSM 1558]